MSFRPALAALAFVFVAAIGARSADAGRHPLFPRFDDRGTLEWYVDLADAQAAAEAQGKLIFVESGRLECPNCMHVVSQVIPSPALRARFAAVAVGLAVDCDSDRPDARVEGLLSNGLPDARMLPLCGFATANLRWVTGFSGFASESDVERHLTIAEQRLQFWKERRAAACRPCEPPRPVVAAVPPPAAPPVAPRPVATAPVAPAPERALAAAPAPAPAPIPAPVAQAPRPPPTPMTVPAPRAAPPAIAAAPAPERTTVAPFVQPPPAPALVKSTPVAPPPEKALAAAPPPPYTPPAPAPTAVPARPPLTIAPDPAPIPRPVLATPPLAPKPAPALAAAPKPPPAPSPAAGAPPAGSRAVLVRPPQRTTAALPPPTRIGEPARAATATGSASGGLVRKAREAAANGRWGEVLRLQEAGVGLPRDAEAIELENLGARARTWSVESLQTAAEEASHDRFEQSLVLLASVRLEMAGRVQEIDAERGERAVERLSTIVRGDPDVAIDCALEARKAYAEFRGTRWASLFKAHLVASSCPSSVAH